MNTDSSTGYGIDTLLLILSLSSKEGRRKERKRALAQEDDVVINSLEKMSLLNKKTKNTLFP
jgi:hypothetical protein